MPQTLSGHVAANIRAELARQRRPQSELVTLLGLSPSAVSRRLSGQQSFELDEVEAIAGLFGVPVADLLPGVAA